MPAESGIVTRQQDVYNKWLTRSGSGLRVQLEEEKKVHKKSPLACSSNEGRWTDKSRWWTR